MSFADIIGQERIVRLLQKALAHNLLPHAFLFTGMEGVGKHVTAVTLAKAVNCQNRSGEDCCDDCVSCRKAESGNHPDINLIESEGPFIKIEQIRALKHRMRFRPLEGVYRVTVIREAQNLKIEAANALLKVLEEPPYDNLIILTANETAALLPTIVSRCLHLSFQPLATPDILAYLCRTQGLPPERAAVVAVLSGGSLTRAAAMLDEEQLERRRWVLQTVTEIHTSRIADLMAAVKDWKGGNAELQQDLEWLKTWIRDILVHQLEKADSIGLLSSDYADKIAAMAALFRPEHLLQMFDLVCTVQGAISYNVNKRLSLETLLILLHAWATGGKETWGTDTPALGKTFFD
jgi:DNA polymerase-3 subunit delta'